MSTGTLPRAPPATGLCHRDQESSEEDAFRDMVESRDMAENVPVPIAPDDSFVLDGAISSLAKDSGREASSSSEPKDGHFEGDSRPTAMPSEGINIVDVSSQPIQEEEEEEGGHSLNQNKMPDPSSEQLKAEAPSSPLAQGEEGGHPECHGEIPDAFSELPSPAGTSVQLAQGEDDRHYHGHPKDPVVPTDSLELGQEAKGSPLVHDGEISEISSEQQKSASISSQLNVREGSGIGDSHGQPPGECPGSPGQPELAGSPKPVVCSEENSQADGAAAALPDTPIVSLPGTNSPRQLLEGDCLVSPSPPPTSASSTELFHPAKINEDIELGYQEITGSAEEGSTSRGQGQLSFASGGQVSREASMDNRQATEELVAQDTTCTPDASSLASADPWPDADTSCQQRAAAAGYYDTAPQVPAAVPAPSPVATSVTGGPAHQGLAVACDGEGREGLAIHESSGAGSDNSKLQGEAEVESERGGEEATRDAQPEETARHPEGAKDPAGSKDLAKELPGLGRLSGTRDPAGAMVLASVEDPLSARERADSHDSVSGSDPNPSEGLLVDVGDPANTDNLVSAADPVLAIPVSGEASVTGGSGWPTNQVGNAPDHLETPIEREIRLHLEREELLRRERGLASSRGTQEYVEVRIRPILNQSMVSSMLPKEKERQRAGAQMQREIQRECRREEDLVQLGKVRGAYDRGTPQELQEKKMIFEQHPSPESPASKRMVYSSSSSIEGMKGPSFAEANRAANVTILDSGPLLRSQQLPPERASSANPFFCLRAKSPQSLLEQEVQEAQEREWELQRQRYALYGAALPCHPAETSDPEEEMSTQPERPSCKKLDVTWPPPSPSETSQVNGLHQLERSPRMFRRQRSALIQRWESGAVGNQENQD